MPAKKKLPPRKHNPCQGANRQQKRKPHGGPRPNSGRKANPLAPLITVETKATAAEMARPYLADAIGALVGTIRNPWAKDSARNAAAKHLLDTAKPAEGAKADDDYEVSNIELARWIISVLENAADEQEAQKAKEGDAA
jgi:hypothetical protein